MIHYCINHPDKKALSFCHSCGEYYCSECLREGAEYYYCMREQCQNSLLLELPQKKISGADVKKQSREVIFIKRTASVLIFFNLIIFLLLITNAGGFLVLMFSSQFENTLPHELKVNIVSFYMFKYIWVLFLIYLIAFSFFLGTSIRVYFLTGRKLFVFGLIMTIILIVMYNVFAYSYFEFVYNSSLGALTYEEHLSFWDFKKYSIVIASFLIITSLIYLINKFSKENIKRVFGR